MCERGHLGHARAIILLMTLAFCALLPAQSPLPPLTDGAARIVEMTGQISVIRNGDLWAVFQNGLVTPGQEVVSGPDGHAILQVADGSRIEVFPNSHLKFHANPGNIRDLIDVWLGKVRVHIEKIGGQPNHQRVTSPTALIAVRGTTFEVSVDASETTTVAVVEGLVEVSHRVKPAKSVFLKDGDTLTVYASEPIAQSSVDRVRVATKIVEQITGRVVDIIRVSKTSIPGTTTASTTGGSSGGGSTASNGTPGTPTPVSGGTGSTAPPTNGRPGGGQNGDTPPVTTTPTTPPTTGGGGTTGPASKTRP